MRKIGDKVWIARMKHKGFTETCPDCLGTKTVTLLLANGERESLECKTCYPGGYEPPRGYVIRTQYQPSADLREINAMEVSADKTTYRFFDSSCEEVFDTEAEAVAAAEVLRVKAEEDDRQRFLWKKEDSRRTWAWNCSYYRNQIKNAKRDLAYAEARLSRCVMLNKAKDPAAVGAQGGE